MHILIAEQSPIGRRMLNRILRLEGYRVSLVENGSEALAILRDEPPDVVLLNVFQCMHGSPEEPGNRIAMNRFGQFGKPVMQVTCGTATEENLADFRTLPTNCDIAFDLLPFKVKSLIMERIQRMCGALEQYRRLYSNTREFDWARFTVLMNGTALAAAN